MGWTLAYSSKRPTGSTKRSGLFQQVGGRVQSYVATLTLLNFGVRNSKPPTSNLFPDFIRQKPGGNFNSWALRTCLLFVCTKKFLQTPDPWIPWSVHSNRKTPFQKTSIRLSGLATSYQRLIHSASKRVRPSSSSSSTSDSAKVRVAICLEGRGEQLAATWLLTWSRSPFFGSKEGSVFWKLMFLFWI